MARFAASFGIMIAVPLIHGLLVSGAVTALNATPNKDKPPTEQLSAWQCLPSWVPYGQTNCVNLNNCQVTNTGSKPTGCGWKVPVFCNETINKAVVKKQATFPAGDAAPAGYKAYPGAGSYKLYTEHKTWDEAKAACAADGQGISLAVPSTAVEYAVVKDMMNTILPNEQAGIWLGMNDLAVEGDFKTVFDQPICHLPLVLWETGEPNDTWKNEDCVGFGWKHSDKLIDFPCENKMAYLCEKPLSERLVACRV